VVAAVPSIERVRFVSSGTEAAMSALRLARAATGRSRILKFEGCYHGHADALLVAAGSGVATLGIPGSPGVPEAFTSLTVTAPYNDLGAVSDAFARWESEIACVIVEPVAGNMGLVLPEPGFLPGLRELCSRHGALLVFDEVMTGFRVARGGAQERFNVTPDLTCLGKVVGGGLPAAAYGGPADLLDRVAPDGPVYQAGTLSGNPLAMAAGCATLDRLAERGVYAQLEQRSRALADGLAAAAAEAGVPFTAAAIGGMFGFFFHAGPVRDFAAAKKADAQAFRTFFAAMLEAGIYLAPSPFEAGFVSLAHRPADVAGTLRAARAAFSEVARPR
jgi:glutamate-1-semialdehyde 2,1-aminomutase